jgi:predicted DNA binding protein
VSIVATFELPAEEFVLGRILSELDDYYVELTQFVPTEEQFIPCVWIEAADLSRVASILADHPRVGRATRIDERAGRGLYEIEWTPPFDDLLSILRVGNCLVTEANGTPDGWQFELLASDQDDLAEFQSACTESDLSITIRTIQRSGIESEERDGLTEKQREIVRLAHERGYFEVPRETTVSDIAAELDISPQAASKRLRRGIGGMVDHVLSSTQCPG